MSAGQASTLPLHPRIKCTHSAVPENGSVPSKTDGTPALCRRSPECGVGRAQGRSPVTEVTVLGRRRGGGAWDTSVLKPRR